MRLIRDITQWRNMKPEVVVKGSSGQVWFCIKDAKTDILTLYAEVRRLRDALKSLGSPVAPDEID